ncbi:T9SS type B sorting domain-containing protein [Mesoflavibacter sp. SCSIO 43206]|uniref:T9SS type B sorting domain-containing protein n=1 Tax=Mesoflavibacter sp. SCSIO 43206 TaxID=2779362 RepID=UPI001CA9EAF7|nr:T9SS type B sorting domain-containing protein [Mesoflavibacter sp. SCSIO 43206]UAB74495.1 T9SS type B sorting domain-containing protein [Mesoflavibacter sp. SCSIO 43206]
MKKFLLTIALLLNVFFVFSQDIIMQTTTVSQCGGVFYDSGGSAGNYANDESFILTICPDTAGQQVQLDFVAFSTQMGSDEMTIYDGDSTAANAFGTFSGGGAAANPGFVSATPNNPTGCLTIEFTSDASANTTGWEANVSCYEPCQTIVSQLDSSSPAPNGDGYIRVCTGDPITLNGSANFSVDGTGATYEWDLGDGNTVSGQTATFSYPNPGVYIVNLNVTDTNTDPDPSGCSNTNLINQVIQVSTEPDFTGTAASASTACFGEQVTLTGVANQVEFINDCTPPVSGTTFLPDGSGATYQTCVTVDCYESSLTLTDVNQIVAICVNMEHSYMGDLDINIISPNGQTAVLKGYPGGNGTYLGGANDDGTNTPGTGADYCFSSTGTVTIENGPTITAGSNPPNNSITPGTYLPEGNLSDLLGSPLNGDWCIEIIDNLSIDNGYIFSWSIEFDPTLQPPEYSFTPVTTSEAWDSDPSIVSTSGNDITVQPSTSGQHCYTYRVLNDFGCEYTETVCIDVYPEVDNGEPDDLFMCNPGAPPYIFDLTENDTPILAPSAIPSDLVITYHESQADADADTNPIPTPDTYTTTATLGNPQTIYVRVEYLNTGCYESETFTLNITAQPTINPASDMVVCDDPSNDGVEPFDLESQTPFILGTQPASDYVVTYHNSFAEADSDTNALTSPYVGGPNEPIYVRIEAAGDATCYSATAMPLFNLIVNANDDSSFTVTPTCDGAVMSNVVTPGGTFALTTTGATIDSATGTVTGAASGSTHTVTYTTTGTCPTTTTVNFTVLTTDDPSFTMQPTCDGAVVDSSVLSGGTYAFNPLPGDGATIDSGTGTITNGTSGATYTVEHTTSGVCPASTTVDVTVYPLEDPSFTATATCDGATVAITGDTGGTFALNPDPGAPVTIDAATGEVTGGDYGTTYTIEYTTSGPCPEVSTQTVTTLTEDDPSFTMIPNCDGGTVDTVAMPGGTYTFNPAAPAGDTVQINPSTGEVTMATPGTSYTVEYTTATQCPATSTFVLNVLPADDSSFTLDPTCDGAIATITGMTGGTFTLTSTGATIDPATGEVTGALPGSTHTVEYTTNGACPTTTTQNVTVHPEVIAIDPTPLEVCDDNIPDGITQIDLTLKDTEVTGGIASYVASYYLTLPEAETATNPLPIPYTNLANGQIVYVRVEDANTGCYDTTTLELQVEQAPTAFTPTALEFCDPDSDGFGEFMLTDADTQVTGGAAGLVVTYHETMSDAENNVNALSSPYDNIVFETQTIYVRVESQTIVTDCASYVELQLIVNETPQIELTPAELEECDDDTDGLAAFDLTQANDELLNLLDSDTSNDIDPSEVTITYYQSETDAEAPSNAIGTPSNYTNVTPDMETIWVRVEYNATGCYTVTDLDLIVNPLPVLVQPDPLNLCDYNNPGDEQEVFTLEDANAQILNGQTGITLTYYDTQAGANTADATAQIFSPYTNGPNPQTVYVRAEDDVTGCVSTITLDLRVNPLPSPATPSPLVACDDDNDGFYTEFDLDSQTTTIINGEPDISISYYETLTNAQNATDPIPSTLPYENIDPDVQTIYVRAENDITGCYTIVTMDLIVEESPVIPTDLEDYVICDDDDDGFNQFDFNTVMTPQILGTQNPADYVLTYHVTQAQAETGANPIVNTGNYTNQSNPQTIYIRLESNINGCVSLGEFEIRVEFPPVIVQPTALSICDELDANYYENNDQYAVFDLTVKNDEITGGVGSWTVTYYETLADAQADTNAIPDPTMYQNTDPGAQTVHVRVTDNDTGCFSLTTLTIRVLPNPTPTPDPTDLELCDDVNIVGPNDMIEAFDLTTYEVAIINGEAGVTASYYTSLDDALAGSNAIADATMHTNEDPDNPGTAINPQTIYVRVTNGDDETGLNGTGCFTIVDFDITVNPLPVVSPIEDYIICELNTDEVAGFDLESKTTEILNGQDATVFTVTYHDTQADADAGINALVSPYNNTSNPQVIYVNITDTTTGCDVTTMFNIEVNEAAQANQSMPTYYECDDNIEFDGNPANDSVQFDLSSQDAAVLMGQDPANYITSYYETLADAEAATNPLPLLYENISNPQVIYVRVDNDTMVDDGTGTMVDSSVCYEIATITLEVNPLPVVDLEDNYLLCVNTNGTEVINPLEIETGLSTSDYTFEWTLNGTVVGTGSSIMPTQGGSYTVTIEDNLTGCISTDTTLVEESAPPSIEADVITPAFADVHSIQVTAIGTGISTYEFQLDGGPWYNNEPNDNTYIFNDVSGGEHTITVRDINGCGESSTTVMVMDYPHFFTPNGDTYNETWQIYGISDQPDAVIYIFDRYGKLLKQLNPTGPGWDGTYNGNPLPTSDYWFTVEYREPGDTSDTKKQFRAHFTLKR